MPDPKSKDPPRWTSVAPESARDPKGPERCLLQAVERLGPLKYKTHEEADRFVSHHHLKLHLSLQFAKEQVRILARDYNGHRHQNSDAPRIKHVNEGITDLENLAGDLARFLEGLDDMTRFYLQTGGTGYAVYCPPPQMEKAEYSRLPHPAPATTEEKELSWVTKLEALSCYANFCLKNFHERMEIDDSDHPDSGGNTNLIKAMAGSPEWGLASAGWLVFDMFKQGEATATEGGPFHSFLMSVFEFATGRDPEQSKLMPSIKDIVRKRRRYMEIIIREQALREELDSLEDDKGNWMDPARADEIGLEQLGLCRERLELAAWFTHPEGRKRLGKIPRAVT
jgi:hypothetical protein